MNYKSLSHVFLIAILAGNCNNKGEEPVKPSIYSGETTFDINQDSVTYCVYGKVGKFNGRNGIYIISDQITEYIQTRSFSFFIPGESGNFPLHEEVDFENGYARANYFYKDEDVILASYYTPEEKANGTVSILHYNPESGEISGEFECTLYLKNNYDLNNAPDSLVIRNGHFETIVVD